MENDDYYKQNKEGSAIVTFISLTAFGLVLNVARWAKFKCSFAAAAAAVAGANSLYFVFHRNTVTTTIHYVFSIHMPSAFGANENV